MDRIKLLEDLREHGFKNDIPNITDANAKFLTDLIKNGKTKNMLEIGTANGFSAICFGIQLEKNNGKLLSIEFSENSFNQAKENIENANLQETINLINGNALDVIPELKETYDFVFIDGMKRRTKDFLELVWDKVSPEGTIVIDDVIKFKEKMVGLYELLEEKNIDYDVIPVDEDDGVMVIVK